MKTSFIRFHLSAVVTGCVLGVLSASSYAATSQEIAQNAQLNAQMQSQKAADEAYRNSVRSANEAYNSSVRSADEAYTNSVRTQNQVVNDATRAQDEAYRNAANAADNAYRSATQGANEAYIDSTRAANNAYVDAARANNQAYIDAARAQNQAYIDSTRAGNTVTVQRNCPNCRDPGNPNEQSRQQAGIDESKYYAPRVRVYGNRIPEMEGTPDQVNRYMQQMQRENNSYTSQNAITYDKDGNIVSITPPQNNSNNYYDGAYGYGNGYYGNGNNGVIDLRPPNQRPHYPPQHQYPGNIDPGFTHPNDRPHYRPPRPNYHVQGQPPRYDPDLPGGSVDPGFGPPPAYGNGGPNYGNGGPNYGNGGPGYGPRPNYQVQGQPPRYDPDLPGGSVDPGFAPPPAYNNSGSGY